MRTTDLAGATSCRIPAIAERRSQLVEFQDWYETLVDVLCSAAQCDPSDALRAKYETCRERMQADYPALRPFLISYLDLLPEDIDAGLKLRGRPLDAFEALVAPLDLREFFEMDDGNMISRINRTREALNSYAEHLRQLAARSA